jgi:S-layer protein
VIDAYGEKEGLACPLTTGVDTINGTAGNDTINAALCSVATLTALDSIDGGAGVDTLEILDLATNGSALPTGLTVKNVENVTVRGADDINVDTSGSNWTGVTSLKSTQSVDSTLTAAATTDVSVSNATGAIVANGGKNVSVSDATANNAVTVGAENKWAAGSITVADSKQGTGAYVINGGTDVTVTAAAVSSGTVTIGHSGTSGNIKVPTGAVTVTSTGTDYVAGETSAALGAIRVDGGTAVTVTQTSTSSNAKAAADTAAATRTQSAVTVNGKTATTAVTVTQDAPVTAVNAVVAVAEKAATTVVTFKALAAGENITLVGDTNKSITFTAAKSLTAAQVAAAFANLAKDATAGSASSTDGVYTNGSAGSIGAGFTTGAVTTVDANNASVTFSTTTDANTGTAGIQAQAIRDTGSTSSKVTVATSVAGVAKVDAVTGKMGVAGGAVEIDGQITGTDVLSTVTLQGYGASSFVKSDALTTLNLSKTAGGLVVHTASTGAITANLDEVGGTLSVDGTAATLTGLTLNVTGAKASEVTVTAATVKDLTISGSQDLKLGSSTTTALETVTVTGTAGVDLSGISANASKSINTSGTTGTVTAKIDAASATYTGGAGKDALTLTNTAAISKAISLGAGDDTLVLGATTAVPTVTVNGGEGVDTLSMNVTSAAAFDDTTAFSDKISGFERMVINNANTTAQTINLQNLGFQNYVTTSGTAGVVYTDATAYLATDKASVVINGVTVTAALPSTPDSSNVTTAINAAANTALSTTGVVYVAATLADSNKSLTVTSANAALYTVTAGTMTDASDVSLASSVTEAVLTLDNLATGATVVLTKDGAITAQVKDAATGTADVLNVTAQVAADVDHGVLTVANVETINLTATDTTPANTSTGAATINTSTLTLAANKAATVKIDGNANVTLTLSGAAELVTLDASAMTGKLIATAAGKTAGTTITGGAGADELTASGTGDVLIGGAGNDKLVAADLSTLTGGAGNDTFVLNAAPSTLNAYSTITDLTAGDKIDTTAKTFKSDAITLASTASFQDFANAAVLAVNANAGDAAAWFQFAGNTFLVSDKDATAGNASAGDGATFENNADLIIAITGLVNLSTAVFNASTGDFTIA